MNRSEWANSGKQTNEYKKIVKEEFKKWKMQYHPNELCDIHHRDDNEECREYNEKYYERWGCEEDGAFIEGKYVIFMTRSEHNRHHGRTRTGKKNNFYGRHHTAEARRKMSTNRPDTSGENNPMFGKGYLLEGENNGMYGKSHSDATKQIISVIIKKQMQATRFLYIKYKENGGEKKWNEFRKALKSGDITFEMRPVSVFTNGGTA